MEEYIPLLQKSPLFRDMDEKDIRSMLKCLNAFFKRVYGREMIYCEGEKVGVVGIVLKGRVQVVREDVHGNRIIMAEWAPGDLFAEAFAPAEVDEIPVSVYAGEKSRVFCLSTSSGS